MRPGAEPNEDEERPADGPDLWQLAGLPGGLLQASYLTSRFSAQYRLIVDVLLAEQEHTLTGVAAAELPGLLRRKLQVLGVDPALLDDPTFRLKDRMGRLEQWGVVYRFQDKAVRDAEFVLDRDRYQLTETVAELHRAITSLGDDTAAAAAATLAPGILTANLSLLCERAETDPAGAAAAWSVIATTHQSMVKAAAGWQARLAGALAGAPTPEKITTVQETLRRYVDMWGAGIDTHSEAITVLAANLALLPVSVWRRIAVHTLGANADEPAVEALVDTHVRTLETLRRWFDGPDCQARKLRRQMRDTIGPLLRGQRTLAAVGGHVSRRAELIDLATRLESASDDNAAWSLWCAATGLFSARHLPGAGDPPAGNPGAVSFWDADPVPVEARLRKQGPKATTGTAARIPDRTSAKRAARERAARAAARAAVTEAAILARSGQRLSQWQDLTAAELELLLVLLGTVAAARPDPAGRRSATTGDARWLLSVEPPLDGAPAAIVHTPEGRLVHPDIVLHITPAGSRP
ncbi:DUF2397 domain-containing protein [Micromonospora sp. WMMA1947]|uniref:DUF2397 domain-containing protein n=1 Tax=Micromonospora sp. WMMA1947 TaxID=3015163 RepID=UPI00248C7E0C|nr:DUF2397 domain-containing protein [Micromonospora sp. WMMA1947]WBC08860.1 DUF2397 domain-containing protein [Micromonospora sp. WMMA1947]